MFTSTEQTASSRNRKKLYISLWIGVSAIVFGAFIFPDSGGRFKDSYWGLNAAYYQRFMSQLPRSLQEELESSLENYEANRRVEEPYIQPESGRITKNDRIVAVPKYSGSIIRYTLDGSTPTFTSPLWEDDLQLKGPTILKARAFVRNKLPSKTVTRAYFAEIGDSLPILSLGIEPVFIADHRVGLFVNAEGRGREWERHAFMSLQPTGSRPVLESEIRIRMHGGISRSKWRNKRLRVLTSGAGPEIKKALSDIVGIEPNSIDNWVLHRPALNNQIYRQRLGNMLANEMKLFTPPSAPCIVLINGEHWGICDFLARVDASLVASILGTEEVILLRGALYQPEESAGDSSDWDQLYELVETRDFIDDITYKKLSRSIDLDNLIDTWIYYIFIADVDRPHNNMDIFRDSAGDEPWKFLVYDTDLGFNYMGVHLLHDTLAWHLREKPRTDLRPAGGEDTFAATRSTHLFRKLMAREDFRETFLMRFKSHLEGVLASESTKALFSNMLSQIEPFQDIELHLYSGMSNKEAELERSKEIAFINTFLDERPKVIRRLLIKHFGSY